MNSFNRKRVRLFASIFCLILPILAGCKDKNGDDELPPTFNDLVTDEVLDDITTHDSDIKDSAFKLVDNGATEYCVIYPHELESDTNMLLALSEFSSFFVEATGIRINSYSDSNITKTDKILSVGNTVQAKNNSEIQSMLTSNALGNDGYIIKTIGNSVYMLGNTAIADLYSVYEFFKHEFGFENYARDEYSLELNVTNKVLKDFNVVDIPDFEARTSCNWESISKRNRTISYVDGFNNADGNTFVHNYFNLVPETNKVVHPKWFYGNGPTGQLCLEAHGDAQERIALKNYVVNSLIARLEAQPNIDWIAFSHNDGGDWCNCEYCTKDAAKYDHGENTAAFASVIKFVNLVAKDIKLWNETVCPERDIVIFIYDYGKVTWAPVKLDSNLKPVLDENGDYQPYSDELILEPNVAIYWCGYNSVTCQVGMENETSKLYLDKLKRSQVIMSNPIRYIWTYSTNFSCYFLPINSVWNRQDKYKLFKKFGARGIFDQAQFDNSMTSDFGALKSYVSAKLLWNCRLDVNKLVNDFMKNYFGPASDTMLELYEQYCIYINDIIENRGYSGGSRTYLDSKYFKYGEIQFFKEFFEKAYKDIESLKTSDKAAYQKYYNRINKESLLWRYLEMTIYPGYFTMDTLNQMQNQFLADALALGIDKASENNSIANIFG